MAAAENSSVGLERDLFQIACPACGYDESHPILESAVSRMVTDRYGFAWWLSTCGRCGLEWQMQPLTTEARQQFYGSGEYRRLCEQVTGKPWTDPAYLRACQRDYAERWLQRDGIDQGFPIHGLPDGRWLDFGGSTGVVSATWAESYRGAARSWKQADPITIIVADYGDGATTTPEQALEMGRQHPYDAVICAQTLDHLPRPLETLKAFLDASNAGGRLFVDVVKKPHTAYKVDHDTYWPSATCFVACVERAGWQVQWYDGETNPTHHTIGAMKR